MTALPHTQPDSGTELLTQAAAAAGGIIGTQDTLLQPEGQIAAGCGTAAAAIALCLLHLEMDAA